MKKGHVKLGFVNFTYFSMQVVKQMPDPLKVGLTCSL